MCYTCRPHLPLIVRQSKSNGANIARNRTKKSIGEIDTFLFAARVSFMCAKREHRGARGGRGCKMAALELLCKLSLLTTMPTALNLKLFKPSYLRRLIADFPVAYAKLSHRFVHRGNYDRKWQYAWWNVLWMFWLRKKSSTEKLNDRTGSSRMFRSLISACMWTHPYSQLLIFAAYKHVFLQTILFLSWRLNIFSELVIFDVLNPLCLHKNMWQYILFMFLSTYSLQSTRFHYATKTSFESKGINIYT